MRSGCWLESAASPISLADWAAYCACDPSLSPDQDHGADYVLWLRPGGEPARFHWYESRISCKNPDGETMVKLLSVAQGLDARLVGDDHEVYAAAADGRVVAVASKPV